jgi:peptide/nickel transport system permease protein
VTVLTAAGLTFVHLLSGTLVVENLFGVPGIGQALVRAVATGDVAAVQSIGVLVAVCFVGGSLLTDLAAVGLDPRLRGRG